MAVTKTLELRTDSTSVVRAGRQWVSETLAGSVPDRVTEALQLAASELITNALEHGLQGLVRVTVSNDGGSASVKVTSRSPAAASIPHPHAWSIDPDPTRATGRGLGIVRRVADRVDLHRAGEIVEVTAAITL